jgi:hypothetical protein
LSAFFDPLNRDTLSSGCICPAVYYPVLQLSAFLSHVIRLGGQDIEFRLRNDDLFEDLTVDDKKTPSSRIEKFSWGLRFRSPHSSGLNR